MKSTHPKPGKYSRVAEHLYRYSVTKKYYAVLKVAGKTKWIALNATDREIAGRNLTTELAKVKNDDPQKSTTFAVSARLMVRTTCEPVKNLER